MSTSRVGFLSSIRGRLILANLTLVVVLLGLSVVSSKQFESLGRTIGVVSDGAELLLRLGHVNDERDGMVGALKTGYGDGSDEGARAKLEALLTDALSHLEKGQHLSAGGEEGDFIRSSHSEFSKVSKALTNFGGLSEDEQIEAATLAEDTLSDAISMVGKAKLAASKNMEARLESVKGELKRPIVLLWSATALGCLLSLLVALFTNRRVARPIAELVAGVQQLGSGKLSHIAVTADDELGRLAGAFNQMADAITEKNRSLELVLDNVGDGLFTVNPAGLLLGRPSRKALDWFAEPAPDARLWTYLTPHDTKLAMSLECGLEQLVGDFLPFELAAEQMPKEFEREGRSYALNFRPVRIGETLERVLVVVSDVSEQRELARKDKRSRDRYSLASLAMRDPEAYRDFCRDTDARLERALKGEATLLELHTIKGNSGVLGCESFAEVVHNAETALVEGAPTADALSNMQSEWASLQAETEKMLGRAANEVVVVRRDQYDRLLRILGTPGREADAAALAQSWSMHQVGNVLTRLAATAERYATREGKLVEVRHEGDHIAVRRGHLDELWACLSHLVKNAVAHSVEPESERVVKGKSPATNIKVSAKVTDGAFVVEVADDGKGIDWYRLADKSGRPMEPGLDLLLAAGSTANDVTELAGRGVGVAAVAEVAQSLGGTVQVTSQPDQGSVFTVKVPIDEQAAYHALPSVLPRVPRSKRG